MEQIKFFSFSFLIDNHCVFYCKQIMVFTWLVDNIVFVIVFIIVIYTFWQLLWMFVLVDIPFFHDLFVEEHLKIKPKQKKYRVVLLKPPSKRKVT